MRIFRPTSYRGRLAPLVVTAVLTGLAGCSGGSSSASSGQTAGHRGGTFTMLWNSPGTSIDTALDFDANWLLLSTTNDGLMTWNRGGPRAGFQLVPDLAAAMPTISDSGRTYVFHVRRGIRYSTGVPVKPSDVRTSLERVFKAGGGGSSYYGTIVGADRCTSAPKTCDLSAGIVADDAAGTVTFHLTTPDPLLPQKLALPPAYLLPPGLPNHDVGTTPLPATGPYKISSYNPRQRLVMVRNPYFKQWSAAAQPAGYPDQIVMKIGLSVEAATTEVQNGQADWMYDQPPSDRLAGISTSYADQVHVHPVPQLYYMSLDTRTGPFNNLDARRAVNYATDRAAIIKIWGGPQAAKPICQILPPGFPGQEPYCPYSSPPGSKWTAPDMAKARQLVTQSGTAGQTVKVIVTTDEQSKAVGLYFVSLLNQLGYHGKLVPLTASVEYSYVQNSKNNPQMSFTYWYPDYPDSADFFDLEIGCNGFHPNSDYSPNLSEFCDPQVQNMFEHALATEQSDRSAADPLWTQLDRTVTDLAPQISLFTPNRIDFVSKRVKNFRFAPSVVTGFLYDQAQIQ
jgi:peptide/nickel transport system substrate-binding protein